MGLIREAEWTAGGHRLYDESVFEQLSRIVELKRTKSLTEIRRLLKEEQRPDSTVTTCAGAAVTHPDTSGQHDPANSDVQESEGGEDMTDTAT
jgi:DNA-binding transcriptional MerR regulator